jgi:hypothetical protein
MPIAAEADNLKAAVRNALLTTHATAVCPFHAGSTLHVGGCSPGDRDQSLIREPVSACRAFVSTASRSPEQCPLDGVVRL